MTRQLISKSMKMLKYSAVAPYTSDDGAADAIDYVDGGGGSFSGGSGSFALMKPGQGDYIVRAKMEADTPTWTWEEDWGATLCESHDWWHQDCNGTTTKCPSLPWNKSCGNNATSSLSITDSVCEMQLRGPDHGSDVIDIYAISINVPVNEMTIKIETSVIGIPAGDVASVSLYIADTDGNTAQLVFEQVLPCTPPKYKITDNGGVEQTLTLSDYGLSGDIDWIDFAIHQWQSTASFALDYIRFH